MKPTVKIDVDGVLENLLYPLIDIYEERHSVRIPYESFTRYDFSNFKPNVRAEFLEILNTEDLVRRLEPLPGAYDTLQSMNELYDVFLVTATEPELFWAKSEWILRHFPFIKRCQILRIPGQYKHMFNTDLAIDDYHENLKKDMGYRILIDAPFNRCNDEAYGIYRVKDLAEAFDTARKIEEEMNAGEGY